MLIIFLTITLHLIQQPQEEAKQQYQRRTLIQQRQPFAKAQCQRHRQH